MIHHPRHNDYDVRLKKLAVQMRGKPFVWGETNCAALVAAAIDAMYGTELHTKSISATVKNEEKARELSARRETRETLLALGATHIQPNFEQVGDFILAFDDPWECSHVVLGKHSLTSSPERGVFLIPTRIVLAEAIKLDGEILRCP